MIEKLFAKQIKKAIKNKEEELRKEINKIKEEKEQIKKLKENIEKQSKVIEKQSKQIKEEALELKRQQTEFHNNLSSFNKREEELRVPLYLNECGIYEVDDLFYRYDDSSEYKQAIQEVNTQMQQLIKEGRACTCSTEWSVNYSKKEGRKQINNTIKMALRLFNAETNNFITSITTRTNINNVIKEIQKSGNMINRFCQTYHITLHQEYINLKIELANLVYEQRMKKQQEKEEARRQAEIIREQEKLEREVAKEREKLTKEIKQYQTEINRLYRTADPNTGELTGKTTQRLEELQNKIEELQEKDTTLEERIHNKAGWVYVITNDSMKGCKIGVTRRLDPQDRIDELGSASVPFRFNKNCVVFSEDAFALEHQLHKAFHPKRINKVNNRKEFFNVTTKEVEDYIKQNIDSTVQFLHDIHNEEYLLSM